MSHPEDHDSTQVKEMRIKVIQSIWGSTVGCFALCIPLVAVANPFAHGSAFLIPVAIAASAAVSTIVIWSLGGRPKGSSDSAALEAKIQALDQRISNMELIEATSIKIANRRADAMRPEQQLQKPTE